LSDCEGYELEMFENVNLVNKNLDFLIEIHEWPLDRNVEKRMIEKFASTHDVIKIYSISDIRKAKEYSFAPFETNINIPISERFNAFKEVYIRSFAVCIITIHFFLPLIVRIV
jgi:hypothetical protein